MTRQFHDFELDGWEAVVAAYSQGFAPLTQQAISALLAAVALRPGIELLDVACGPGWVAAAGARAGSMATGLDFAAPMIKAAADLHPDCTFEVGDAEQLPYPDARFHAVVCNFGLLHLAQPDQAIAEAFRVLIPGGRFAFTVWAPPERAIAFKLILDAVAAFGNPAVPLPPGPPFFRFSDPNEATATMTRAGFVDAVSSEIPQTWRLASSDLLWHTMLNGTVRTRGLLQGQTSEALTRIRASVLDQAEQYKTAGGEIEIPMPAVLTSGRKP